MLLYAVNLISLDIGSISKIRSTPLALYLGKPKQKTTFPDSPEASTVSIWPAALRVKLPVVAPFAILSVIPMTSPPPI